jgi:hypothetical protein
MQLRVTPARVRQMIIAGRLPAQRFGRSHMILESDLHLVEDRRPGRPPKTQSAAAQTRASGHTSAKNGTSKRAAGRTTKLNKAFRQATELESKKGSAR